MTKSKQRSIIAHALLRLATSNEESKPVSYTHLDVYKRQAEQLVDGSSQLYDGIGTLLDACELFLVIICRKIEPTQKVIAEAAAIMQHLSLIHIFQLFKSISEL